MRHPCKNGSQKNIYIRPLLFSSLLSPLIPGGYLKHPANSEGFKHIGYYTKKNKNRKGCVTHYVYGLDICIKKKYLKAKRRIIENSNISP
jgi:hypothetical protein